MKKIRVLIYNGDADACVPYKGNEQWVDQIAGQGVVKVKKAWHPWFVPVAYQCIPAFESDPGNEFAQDLMCMTEGRAHSLCSLVSARRFAEDVSYMPAGYATSYTVPGSDNDFQFVTIRLAGHMVPAFQPRSAHTFFKTFIAGKEL